MRRRSRGHDRRDGYKVIDSLAPTGKVGTLSIEGLGWGEVDYLNDIEVATKLTDGWV